MEVFYVIFGTSLLDLGKISPPSPLLLILPKAAQIGLLLGEVLTSSISTDDKGISTNSNN